MAVWCDSTGLNRATVVYILLTETFESSQVVNLAVCIFWMCRHGVNLIDVNLKNSRRLPFSKVVVCDKKPSWLPVLICILAAFVAGSTAVETRQVVRVRILSKQHLQSVLLIIKTHTHMQENTLCSPMNTPYSVDPAPKCFMFFFFHGFYLK